MMPPGMARARKRQKAWRKGSLPPPPLPLPVAAASSAPWPFPFCCGCCCWSSGVCRALLLPSPASASSSSAGSRMSSGSVPRKPESASPWLWPCTRCGCVRGITP